MNIYRDVFGKMPRQGPGSVDTTTRAWRLIPNPPTNPTILDLGCGSGGSTLTLARLAPGAHLHGVDLDDNLLRRLENRARAADLFDRITLHQRSMADVDVPPVDIVWSEGAIYSIGFENGLRRCRDYVKPGGYVAVSEAVYLTDDPPEILRNFWEDEYPAIDTMAAKREIITGLGYRLIADFVLPRSDWWEGFYEPMLARIQHLREVHADDRDAQETLDQMLVEVNLYRDFGHHFGYGFFIMQAP